MTEFLKNSGWLIDALDIALVAVITYRLFLLLKGTLAVRILFGLALVLFCQFVSRFAGLQTFNWILNNFLGSLIIVLAIIFQHDIRRALFALSRSRSGEEHVKEEVSEVIEELAVAAEILANKMIGALVVIERGMALDHFLAVGTEIDAKVTSELLTSIFLPYSPIHDGAVIIQRGKLTKAGCFLPLTQNPEISKALGTRHRAAIGLTEIVDAVVVVVSEETGKISIAVGGRITRDLEPGTLRKVLKRLLDPRWLQ
jgi:diadenylate cyclase